VNERLVKENRVLQKWEKVTGSYGLSLAPKGKKITTHY
jgi:hypothetical protein